MAEQDLRILVTTDIEGARKAVETLRRDAPAELAKALTFTTERVRDGLRAEMSRVFIGPVPFTLNSLRLKTATAQRLEAEVKIKDEAGKGTPAIKYLAPQIYGGNRGQKRFERSLERSGLLPNGWVTVPGDAVKLDASGNVPSSVYVRVLSQLRVQIFGGFESRIGGKDLDKAKVAKTVKRQGGRFFVGKPGNGRMPLGIWFRQTIGLDETNVSTISPMFLFVPSAKYKKRFDFFGVGNRLTQVIAPQQIERRFVKYLARF